MDTLAGFWSKATGWVLLLIVAAIALVAFVFYRMRPRKPPAPIRAPDPSWSAADANLDSSHIGGPIFPEAREPSVPASTGTAAGAGPAPSRK